MPSFDLAIFDFDGTLGDSVGWFAEIVNQVAREFRFREIDADEAERLRSTPPRAILAQLGVPLWKLPLIARRMRNLAARDIGLLSPFPGALDLLRRLDEAGVQLAIVSSNTEANVRRILGAEAAALVGHYGCGAGLFGKARKFRRVLRQTGVSPQRALAIGDECRDHDAARKVGLPFGAVSWGFATPDFLRSLSPEFFFEEMEAIFHTVAGEPLAAQARAAS